MGYYQKKNNAEGHWMASSIKAQIKQDWSEAKYYAMVEADHAMAPFWSKGSLFRGWFETLDLTRTVELACGHGRHSAYASKNYDAIEFTLVDINEPNIEICRDRFRGDPRFKYLVNSGSDLKPLGDGEYSAVFCYDAMVHFEYDDVFSYIRETYRVLAPKGRALVHHSNNDKQPGNIYSDNIHWRNFMSAPLFYHVAKRTGFKVVSQQTFDWGDAKDLDCLTLLEKA